jgi:serine phosphatase RsbU (regulator of sigma subunit)
MQILYAQTQTVVLTDSSQTVSLANAVEFFEDPSGALQLFEVKSKPFEVFDREVFAKPGTHSAFWFRFRFQNLTSQDAWLELGCNFNWYLDFYSPLLPDVYRSGLMRQEAKFQPHYVDWLPLQRGSDTSTQYFYFRVIQNETGFELPMLVGTLQSLGRNKFKKDLVVGIFVGLVLVMILYNSFLFFSVFDRIYLYYVLYLVNVFAFVTYLVYYPFVETLFEGFVEKSWWYRYSMIWTQGNVWFAGLFCIRYLRIKERLPKIRQWILFLMCFLCFVIPILNLVGYDSVDLSVAYQISILVFYFSCLFSAFYLSTHHREARLYALGWTFLVLSVFIYIGVVNGFVVFNFFTHNILIFGAGFEIALFSLALGDRLNALQTEKAKYQEQILGLMKNQNQVLELKVKERTEEVLSMNEELQQQHEELKTLNQSLEYVNATLEFTANTLNSSIRYAKRIQQCILPNQTELRAFFKDHAIIFKPRDVVSGDFYWFHEIDKNQAIFILADSTGHGVPGAFMSMIGNTLLHQIVRNNKLYDPAEIIGRLDQEIISLLKQKQTGNSDGMDITVCLFEKKLKHTLVSFAASKQKIFFSNMKSELVELKGDRCFVGGFKTSVLQVYGQKFTLEPEKNIILLTDGILDQQNLEGKMFGNTKLKKILSEIQNFVPQDIKNRVEQEILAFQGKSSQRDDQSLIVLKPL